ncbi:DNA-3-methyladenine glycosylase family protein [Rubrivirga sp.]|uniref:DNA-3-methyladenine glycosylase family protein n=1 Tax=Rubrivirga sp. TaxID=1885344 RepID=UPI003B52E22D
MTLPYDAVAASQALAEADPRLGDLIASVGPPRITLRPDETLPALLRSIIYQQLSTKAAATILGRVLDAFGDGDTLDPAALAAAPDEALRACGLSRAKTAAARDLVARHRAGTLPTRANLLAMPDDAVVAALTAVRGVGPWTAQMVLLFNLGRPDVWPTTDLGVQEGYRIIAGLDERPGPKALAALGEPYAPWRSVAAWYGWRAVHRARGEE